MLQSIASDDGHESKMATEVVSEKISIEEKIQEEKASCLIRVNNTDSCSSQVSKEQSLGSEFSCSEEYDDDIQIMRRV